MMGYEAGLFCQTIVSCGHCLGVECNTKVWLTENRSESFLLPPYVAVPEEGGKRGAHDLGACCGSLHVQM